MKLSLLKMLFQFDLKKFPLSSFPLIRRRRPRLVVMHWPKDFSSRGDKSVSAKLLLPLLTNPFSGSAGKRGRKATETMMWQSCGNFANCRCQKIIGEQGKALFCPNKEEIYFLCCRSDNLSRAKKSRGDFARYLFPALSTGEKWK